MPLLKILNCEKTETCDLSRICALQTRMKALEMPLLIHGEITDPEVDVFDRNAIFMVGLRNDFHCLPVVKWECHRRALARAAFRLIGVPSYLGPSA